MPQYRYKGYDGAGRPVQGATHALSIGEAERALREQGLRIAQIAEETLADASRGPVGASPRFAPPAPPPVPSRAVPIPVPARPDRVRTRWGHDKAVYFVFSQLSSYLRAGLNPVRAMTDVSARCRRRDYGQALQAIGEAAARGESMADGFERYPYLFPPHAVGMVRAGEVGGFLPEAFEAVSAQAFDSLRYKRWYFWLGLIVGFTVLCGPFAVGAADAGIQALRVQMDAGGMAPPWGTILGALAERFLRFALPILLAMGAVVLALRVVWGSMTLRPLRHQLVLAVPGARKRAISESLAAFSWALGQTMRGGASPQTAWQVAAQAMPNLEMRRKAEAAGKRMSEGSKLSEALDRSDLLPHDYRAMVATGEITGDLPGALAEVANLTRSEFQVSDQIAKGRLGLWMILTIFLGTAALGVVVYRLFYQGVFDVLEVWLRSGGVV